MGRKRTKTKIGLLSCPACGGKTFMVEMTSFSERWNRFRVFCSKKDHYGAWRVTKTNAAKAWNLGKTSSENDIGE